MSLNHALDECAGFSICFIFNSLIKKEGSKRRSALGMVERQEGGAAEEEEENAE
jgi:hypothetical protein